MLTKINPSWVKSDEGYSLRHKAGFPNVFIYNEEDYFLRIPTDFNRSPRPTQLVFFSQAKRWEPPHHLESIDADARERIRIRFIEMLEFFGDPYVID